MKPVAVLTASEVEILRRGIEDPNAVTEYFFATATEPGFTFDYQFVEEGKWQLAFHQASQRDITIIGGFATGKTVGVAMSAVVFALLTENFKFLNVAEKEWQAKQMYDALITLAKNTRFDDLISEKTKRPYKIILRYKIDEIEYESSLEFMSVDKNAQGILSWEGDWLNIDEAGLLLDLEGIIINVGSRLRGTVRGRERLGRFSMISNSWDNFYLWYYFDLAAGDPENFLSMNLQSEHNKNVTDRQLARMVARIPVEERDRFLKGLRPEGKGRYFDRESIYSCEDQFMGEIVYEKALTDQSYGWVKAYGAGIVYYAVPPQRERLYMLFGDPGIEAPPRRNSPVLMLWDVTDVPNKPATLTLFWWGDGHGKIRPFVQQMLTIADTYHPIRIYIDSTGPQKNAAELINEHVFKERFKQTETIKWDNEEPFEVFSVGYESPIGHVGGIQGMDFSGSRKFVYLQSCKLFLEAGMLRWPKEITGFRSQLSNYDPEDDKKIAQDIVAALSMSCFGIRSVFHVSHEAVSSQNDPENDISVNALRRLSEWARSRRSRRVHS